MSKVKHLLEKFAQAEQKLQTGEFVAPCIPKEKVCTTVDGLVYWFKPEPDTFEGWGIFLPEGPQRATLVGEADSSMSREAMQSLPKVKLYLSRPLQGKSWEVVPADAPSAQKLAKNPSLVVRLVQEGDRFDRVQARIAPGGMLVFEEIDPLAEPQQAQWMRESWQKRQPLNTLRFPGLTPEMKAAYQAA